MKNRWVMKRDWRALVGSFLADHHTEERCLARPIGTDQSDFFAGIQLKRSVDEEQLLAILLIDVRERDHFERSNSRHAASSSVARPENCRPALGALGISEQKSGI